MNIKPSIKEPDEHTQAVVDWAVKQLNGEFYHTDNAWNDYVAATGMLLMALDLLGAGAIENTWRLIAERYWKPEKKPTFARRLMHLLKDIPNKIGN